MGNCSSSSTTLGLIPSDDKDAPSYSVHSPCASDIYPVKRGLDISPIALTPPQRSALAGAEVFQPRPQSEEPKVRSIESLDITFRSVDTLSSSIRSKGQMMRSPVTTLFEGPSPAKETPTPRAEVQGSKSSVLEQGIFHLKESNLIDVITIESKIPTDLSHVNVKSCTKVVEDMMFLPNSRKNDANESEVKNVCEPKVEKSVPRRSREQQMIALVALAILFCFYASCVACSGWLLLSAVRSAKVLFLPQSKLMELPISAKPLALLEIDENQMLPPALQHDDASDSNSLVHEVKTTKLPKFSLRVNELVKKGKKLGHKAHQRIKPLRKSVKDWAAGLETHAFRYSIPSGYNTIEHGYTFDISFDKMVDAVSMVVNNVENDVLI